MGKLRQSIRALQNYPSFQTNPAGHLCFLVPWSLNSQLYGLCLLQVWRKWARSGRSIQARQSEWSMTVEHRRKLRRQKQIRSYYNLCFHFLSLLFPHGRTNTRHVLSQKTTMHFTCGAGWGGTHTGTTATVWCQRPHCKGCSLLPPLREIQGSDRVADLHREYFTHWDISQAQNIIVAKTYKQKFLCPPRSYLQSISLLAKGKSVFSMNCSWVHQPYSRPHNKE